MPKRMIRRTGAPRRGERQLIVVLLAMLIMAGVAACSSSTTGNTGNTAATTPAVNTGSTGNTGNTGSLTSAANTGNTGNTGDFCSTHTCIPNFPNGTGYIVQCADGEWSHSGGRPGACSGHGGETGNTPGNPGNTGSTGSTAADTGNTGSGTGNTGNTGSVDFCSTHTCIPNFPNGTGYVVQCADGEWSHSGGRPGACSDHGGETGNTPGNAGNTGGTGNSVANTGNSGSGNSNTGSAGSGGGPLSTLNSYWSSISNRDYGSAYNDLASAAVNLTQAQFVSQEQQAGIQSVAFNGHITAQTGTTATVSVDALTTKDKQFGCRTWSGSYQLVEQNGQWLIERANITPQRCGG